VEDVETEALEDPAVAPPLPCALPPPVLLPLLLPLPPPLLLLPV
jgi:hypothetical protein